MRFFFRMLLITAAVDFHSGAAPSRAADEDAPKMKFAEDGLPTGNNTAEGVACDAIRAYLEADGDAWLATLVRPIYGEEKNKEFEEFKRTMVAGAKGARDNPPGKQLKLVRCYKVRSFSANGPGSLAYAMGEFHFNGFVDLVLENEDKKPQKARYHVLMDKHKKWFFEPRPDLAPLFSMGLNEESASTEEIKPQSPAKPKP